MQIQVCVIMQGGHIWACHLVVVVIRQNMLTLTNMCYGHKNHADVIVCLCALVHLCINLSTSLHVFLPTDHYMSVYVCVSGCVCLPVCSRARMYQSVDITTVLVFLPTDHHVPVSSNPCLCVRVLHISLHSQIWPHHRSPHTANPWIRQIFCVWRKIYSNSCDQSVYSSRACWEVTTSCQVTSLVLLETASLLYRWLDHTLRVQSDNHDLCVMSFVTFIKTGSKDALFKTNICFILAFVKN